MEMVLNWWMVCILLATGHFIPAAAKSFSIQSTISAHKYNVHRSGVSVNSRGANGRALKALDESNFAGQSILVSSERNVASPAALKDAEFHIRIIMLLFYATLGSLLPYLPVYYRHLGLDDHAIGMLGAITPAVTFLLSPLWGAYADRYNLHKFILIFTFIGSVLTRSFFLLLQQQEMYAVSAIVAVAASLSAPVKPLLDAGALATLKRKTLYGRSRLFGQIGFGVGSFISGLFVARDMNMVFLIHFLFAIPTTIMMWLKLSSGDDVSSTGSGTADGNNNNSVDTEKQKKSLAGLWTQLKPQRYEILLFFTVVLSIGTISGIIENFSFNRIVETTSVSELGNKFGIFTVASSVAGGPMFWMSGKLISSIGVPGILIASLLSYCIRFGIYIYMTSPWHAIPAEFLRGATFASFWAATTHYVYSISPPGHGATMLGLLNGVYAGLGQSLGSLIGGALSRRYGISGGFKRAGIGSSIVAIFYILAVRALACWS